MATSIIYLITNLISGTQYIGFTSKLLCERIKTHKSILNSGYKNKLYESMRSYGWKNFEWKILYQSWDNKHCLDVMEPHFIEQYDTYNNGYNMTRGGEGAVGYWNEQTKKMQSEFIKTTWTTERRIKNGLMAKERMTNIPKTTEHINNMRGKRAHVNQKAENNNNAKAIITPYGKFDSIKTAFIDLNSKGIKLSYDQIWYKVNKKSDWNYVMQGKV
jgi:group I intron endonuclease